MAWEWGEGWEVTTISGDRHDQFICLVLHTLGVAWNKLATLSLKITYATTRVVGSDS